MDFDEFSLLERHERARRIHFAMLHDDSSIDFGDFSKDILYTSEVKEKIRDRLLLPSKMSEFFSAASLVRKNPIQWIKYMTNPSRRPPKVFESFSDDKLLIFYLFFCDKMKIFHLDPDYPFFICDQVDTYTYVVRGEADDDLGTVQAIIKMWISTGSPWKESDWGVRLLRIAEMLRDNSAFEKNKNHAVIGWYFWELTHHFGFVDCLHGQDISTDIGFLDLPQFAIEASIAVALDNHGLNTLELIHELFPQFPELIPNTIRVYFLSITNSQPPTHQNATTSYARERMLKQEGESFIIARTVLYEIFDVRVSYSDIDENIPLRNQSIKEFIRKFPELFIRWTADSRMRNLYRRLIDPKTLFE